MIVNKRQFYIGLVMIIVFSFLFVIMMSPVVEGKNIIQTADDLFNSLTKGSSYNIPKLLKSTDKYIGTPFEATMTVSSKDDVAKITKVFGTADVKVEPIDDTKVKISGDLGKMAKVALTDADSLFSNEDSKIAGKYGIKGQDAVNYWWTGFNTLEGKYKKEAEADLMNFVKSVNTKGLEVAYNFKGIEAENVADKAGVTAFMLVFYVFYTVFYGFAIMYLMEGLGIVASAHGEKAEA